MHRKSNLFRDTVDIAGVMNLMWKKGKQRSQLELFCFSSPERIESDSNRQYGFKKD